MGFAPGQDERGRYFPIPPDDLPLLSAINLCYEKKREGLCGQVYDTGIYIVRINPKSGECEVRMRVGHWQTGEERITHYVLGRKVTIEPTELFDPGKIGYDWSGADNPSFFWKEYLWSLISLGKKMAEGNRNVGSEHDGICSYGLNKAVRARFGMSRLHFKEAMGITVSFREGLLEKPAGEWELKREPLEGERTRI
ncbi:MAG: hypothetical protein WC686_03225 [Candidatus Shapirobacteria bacterium]|jgi:hypothetical protein